MVFRVRRESSGHALWLNGYFIRLRKTRSRWKSFTGRAILDALARGLDYEEMAVEFNERKLRRGNNYRQPWTAKYLILRWGKLRQRQQKREQEQSANAALGQVAILKKST